MAYETVLGGYVPIQAWTDGVLFEEHSKVQLRYVAMLPCVFHHVAVMPDVCPERGSTVGSVIPTLRAVIPAAVGVDIGCGMMAVRTTLTSHDLKDNAEDLRIHLEKNIPTGGDHGKNVGHWDRTPQEVVRAWEGMREGWREIVGRHGRTSSKDVEMQLGTLGGGNHFIEVDIDEEDHVWFMLHSGSRRAGNRIGTYFIELARKDMMRQNKRLPNMDLSYFEEGSEHFTDYVNAVGWAQKYASVNRELLMFFTVRAIRKHLGVKFMLTEEVVNCHHNYVQLEEHYGERVYITRKGAVSARAGEMGIIPGSMGTKSYIVRGKGNPESFHSCAHGAGRALPRGEAGQRITLERHRKDTEGVACRKDKGIVDESPSAYKDIDLVMEAQKDLVETVHTLRPVISVKG